MGGISPLLCKGFIESPSFEQSKGELMAETGLSPREIDDRLEALVWALSRGEDEDETGAYLAQVPGRNLWVAVIPRGVPPLHVYLRPRPDGAGECEWLWIERRDAGQ